MPFQGDGDIVWFLSQGNALGTGTYDIPVRPERAPERTGVTAMSQSLVQNLLHLVFSTKHRAPLLTADIRPEMNSYLAGILRAWDSPAILVNSVEDHVHLLFALSKNHALKKVVEEVKKGSSKWVKTKGPAFADFYWQAGYGAFSVSQSNVEAVRRYIANHEEHHRKMTFQDELRSLLKNHGIEYDERYVWD
jgi:putative transposase